MDTCKTCRFYEADMEHEAPSPPSPPSPCYYSSNTYPGYMHKGERDAVADVGRCRKSAPKQGCFFPQVDERAWCGEWERILNPTNEPCPPPPPSGKELPE